MLKKLLKHKNHIWFSLKEEDKKSFLEFAKNNNCKWVNGKEINLQKDKCSMFMGISKNFTLGYISGFCWNIKTKKDVLKVSFKDVKNNFGI